MSRAGPLLSDARGTATVEFAIASLFLFGTMLVGLDFGVFVQQKLKLGDAVAQGAMMAFNNRDTINAGTVSTYVKTLAALPSTPTVTCNDASPCLTSSSRGNTDYRCLTATGEVGTTGYALGAACPDGKNIAGYYLTISASKVYTPMLVPDRYLGGKQITQTVVVRLQ